MNKIYKVVWSKVKNCYVVVSEIAKNIITGGVKSAKVGNAPMARGLALGALMAFVITGSAMAAEKVNATIKPSEIGNYVTDGSLTVEVGTGMNGIYGESADCNVNVNLTGDLTVISGADGITFMPKNDKVLINSTVEADNVYITSTDGKGIYLYEGTGGGSVKDSVYTIAAANDIAITTVNGEEAIRVKEFRRGQTVNVIAGDELTVNGTVRSENAKALNLQGNSIKVYGNNSGLRNDNGALNVTATDSLYIEGDVYGVRTEGRNGVLSIKAKDINVVSDYEALRAQVGGTLNVEVTGVDGKAVIDGDVMSIGGSTINVDLGKKGSLTGEITTDVDSTTTLDLGNGSTWNMTGDSTVTTLYGDGDNLLKAEGVEDVTLIVTGDNDGNNNTGGFEISKLDIEGVDLKIETDETAFYNTTTQITSNSDVTVDSAKAGIDVYGKVEIDAANVTFNTVDDAVFLRDDSGNQNKGAATINASGDVSLTSTKGYALNNVSTQETELNVSGENVTLISKDRAAVKSGHLVTDDPNAYKGVTNVSGTTVTIEGAAQAPVVGKERYSSAVYAQGGTINLSATDTITIKDTAKKGGNAIGAYGGVVNVKDAANVVIDGKVYATGEGSQVNITTTGDVAVNDAGIDMSSKEEDALAVATNKGAITITGNNANTITLTGGGGEWDNGRSQAIAASYGGTATVKDFKEVVFAGEHAHSGFYAFAGGTTVVENIGTIKQDEGSYIGQAFNAFGGNLTVKADVIDIDNAGNGIFAQTSRDNDGILNVEAKTIDIKAGANAIGANKMHAGNGTVDVYVKADNITLEVANKNSAINTFNAVDSKNPFNNDSKITVVANEKLIVKGSNAVNSRFGISSDKLTVVDLTAKEMEIINNGANNALRAADYGQINVNASDSLIIDGMVKAERNSEININANTAFDADVTSFNADDTSKINLTGGAMSGTLNIVEGTKVHLTGATFTAEKLDDAVDGGGVLVLDGSGVLKTKVSEVFTDTDTTAVEGFDNEVIVNEEVVYKAGAISLAEDYSYEYLEDALKVMKAHEYEAEKTSATKIIMTGNLKTNVEDIGGEDNKITADQASGLGNGVELDKVTVEADNNLLIGANVPEGTDVEGIVIEDSVANGFSANELQLGAGSNGAVITGGQEITLGGSQGSEDLVSAEGSNSVKVVIGADVAGTSDATGTLNIGNTGANEDTEYTLNGSVKVNEGSELNTKGQTEITGGVELDGGSINVENGQLSANLTVAGESTITGSVSGELTADSGATINIGTADKTATTSFDNVKLNGATVVLDPAWDKPASQNAFETSVNGIDGQYAILRNNYVTFGTTNNEAKAMFEKTGLTFGENAISAALYIKGNQTITQTGGIYLDGSKSTDDFNKVAGTFSVAANSITMVDANTTTASLSGVVTATIDDAAKLYIDEATDGQTYKVLDGVDNGWQDANILTNNQLIKFTGDAQQDGAFNVTADLQNVSEVYGNDVIIADVVDKAVSSDTPATDFFNATVNEKVNATKEAQVDAMNSAGSINELAGVSHTTYAVSNILTDAVAGHMSLANAKEHDKDIWAHYVHTKENIEGLKGASEYDAQYNGIVVGADLYKEGKATVGAALTYVDGNINGSTLAARTENDAKYYGASIYGSIENKDAAVIADVSYLHGEHDITQRNSGATITGKPESDAFSVGVRVEQAAKAGIGKLVPYAGIRYMHLGTGNYANSIGLAYDADDAELFLLPVGLKYSSEVKNTNGWTVRPVVELGYVWAFGDTDTNQTVSLNGASNGFGYDITDSGSYIGRFALEAEKANISYALGYEYQKGDDVKADKWMVNVNWKF